MSFESAIQTTVYTVLNTALSVSVYDNVPQPSDGGSKTDYPYITIGEDVLTVWDTATESGTSASITVHTWSRAKGRKETKDLQGLIYSALHKQALSVSGYQFIGCDWESSQSFLDSDGDTRHGIQTFRILIDEL